MTRTHDERAPAHAFVKWVGGKRQLLPQILPHFPGTFGRYHEPFLGGGTLFWHMRAAGLILDGDAPVLVDANPRLIRAYQGVRDDVEGVIERLNAWPRTREHFLEVRARTNIEDLVPAESAAWFIYLNKLCFNGLYRVNKRGVFNVPYGSQHNPLVCDSENLRACSAALADAALIAGDFTDAVAGAIPGDLVYFDPPYVPASATSNFTAYTVQGFGLEDQERLRDVAVELVRAGVHVRLSNSCSPIVERLYDRPEFELVQVSVRRSVAALSRKRKRVHEYLIVGRAS